MLQHNHIKCIVWDLDNTLWKGALAESDQVELYPGRKEMIKSLDARGVLHSIASKNHRDEAMSKLQDYGLAEYFLYPEINWNAKSGSICNIQKKLNIGMDSILFIDDQPFEREEVKSSLPQVECRDVCEVDDLLAYHRLNPAFITRDAARRRLMYLEDMQRNEEEAAFRGPKEAFLATLQMNFTITPAREEDLQRAEELTIRTNQLNATGSTYSYEELNAFRKSPGYLLLVCELSDKYGSYGKIGLCLIEKQPGGWNIKLLLMSCRVLSRGAGTVMLSYIMQQAERRNRRLTADFRHTTRNKMMYVTYKFAGFREIEKKEDGLIILFNELDRVPSFPAYIRVNAPDLHAASPLIF